MSLSRRGLIKGGSAVAVAFSALSCGGVANGRSANQGLPLKSDPNGLLELPEGFSYRVVAKTGDAMSDGFIRPGRADGMACFAHPADRSKLVLVSNHENWADTRTGQPWGDDAALEAKIPAGKRYDPAFFGGTTTTTVDARTGALVSQHLSLIGSVGNCAGGRTPWGSWLSCEEQMLKVGESNATKDHGYVFEVPVAARGLVDPAPLKAMGRFTHEAAAVDPATGIVYLTEDHMLGPFYRFLPVRPGRLAEGGKLQALVIKDWPSADTRNWPADWSEANVRPVTQGQSFNAEWIDLEDVEAQEELLRVRAVASGAALFCRGEGIDIGRRADGSYEFFFNATQGGRARNGQVWRYIPNADGKTGELTLFYESPGADHFDTPDNLAVTPWGDLMICEDGLGDQYLRLLAKDGQVRDFARNAHEGKSEFCGACFSPDGRIMFVNVQEPGITFAISGPWNTLRSA